MRFQEKELIPFNKMGAVVVRIIVRANSVSECEKRVKSKEREGWVPLTKVKADYSAYYDESFVCVMEKKELGQDEKRWNRRIPL